MTSLELFRAIAPELEAETADRVGTFLTLAATRLTSSAWGAVYAEAVVLLAAHMITLSPAAGTAEPGVSGAITSRTAGDLSVTYAASTSSAPWSDAWYARTTYGQQFVALRNTRAAGGPRVVDVHSA